MTFSWGRGLYNARGSFNRWLQQNISANNWPASITAGFNVNFEYPDVPLSFPSVAVTHLGGEAVRSEGHVVGGYLTGLYQHQLTDVSIWASGSPGQPWIRQLLEIRDMMGFLLVSAKSIPLLNLYTSTAAPSSIGIIRFGPGPPLEDVAAPLEPSPNIHRQRMLVRWFYLEHI